MDPKWIKKTHFNPRKRVSPIKHLRNTQHSTLVLKALESGLLTKAQYESFRRMIIKALRGTVRLWFPPLYCIPITRKTAGHRMGKGVGTFEKLVFPIRAGGTLVEITVAGGLTPTLIRIFSIAVKKLPLAVQFNSIRGKNTSLNKSM